MKSISENNEFYLLPASFGQKRMWFFEKMFPNSSTYNVSFMYKIKGELDIKALESSIRTILERHEVFRTTFCEVEGELVQQVAPQPIFSQLDIYQVEKINEEMSIEEYMKNFAIEAFDLNYGPLIKFQLIEMKKDYHFLLTNVHHIIFDAWSTDILKKELNSFYRFFANGEECSLKELEFHYADFAQWEKESIEKMDEVGQIEFWRNYLLEAPSTLEISSDYLRPKKTDYKGANYKFALPEDLVEKVRAFVKTKGHTLNAFYMTVFNILLYRYTGQKDVVIGTPISNRKESFTQDLIGFFVNTIPVRTSIRPYSNFSNALKATIQSFLHSYEHSNIPFEKIVQELNPERESSRNPIFQILFTYHEQVDSNSDSNLVFEEEKINTNTSKFDLVFYISNGLKKGIADIEYNAELYHPETIKRFAQHYIKLISEILNDPKKPVSKYNFLTTEEKKDLLYSPRKSITNRYIHEYFEQQVIRNSHHVAVKGSQCSYTYEELNKKANQVANAIKKSGIKYGSIIGIRMNRSPQQIAAALGVIKSGCAYLPIDPALPMNRVNYMLVDTRSAALLTDEFMAQGDIFAHTINIEEVFATGDKKNPVWDVELLVQDLGAYVMYTSGSTGKPKGVSVSQAALLNHIDAYFEAFPFQKEERVLYNMTFSFDPSILDIFGALLGGATIIVTDQEKQFDVDYLANLISSESVSRAQLFHSLIEKLIEIPAFTKSKSLHSVITGGQELNQKLVDAFYTSMENDVQFINLYGPTEATVAATFQVCKAWNELPSVPIGKALKNYALLVLDENLQPVPKGVEGELFIGGPCLAKEYINNKETTDNKFVVLEIGDKRDRFYRTGDIVKQSQDGSYRFISRKDTQVKIRGFRIELNEIKNVLLGIEGIDQAAVIAKEHLGEKKLFSFIVRSDSSLNAKKVKGLLIQELPHYMVPSSIVFMDEIPISVNGKLLKDELPYHLNDLVDEEKIMFSSDLEEKLCSIWESVLGINSIGINEDFFDIGGHSIKALEVVGAIRKRLGVNIPLSCLFEYRTIEQLGYWIEGKNEKIKEGIVVPLKEERKKGLPLFLIHPGGGGALCYVHLARALDIEGDIYGIQSVGYEFDEDPLLDISSMATRYVKEIRKIQPKGPYLLAGWSMGGTIAIEMGRILENSGEVVEFLGLLDAYPFHQASVQPIKRDPLDVWAHTLRLDLTKFSSLLEEDKYEEILKGAKKLEMLPQGAELEDAKRVISIMGANNLACSQYHFEEPIASDLYLFRCSEHDPVYPHFLVNDEDWKIRTKGRVCSIEISGHHNNIMVTPHVEFLASCMSEIINEKEKVIYGDDRKDKTTASRDARKVDTAATV